MKPFSFELGSKNLSFKMNLRVVVFERTFEDKLEAFKNFYNGYYKSFYQASSKDEILKNCMDDTTITKMI
jgi:hypothetical protein